MVTCTSASSRATLLLLAAAFGAAQTITFSDGAFNDSDWTSSIQLNDPAAPSTFAAGQVTSDGNPGAFRRVRHSLPRIISVAHIKNAASFQGGIVSIDYSYDLANFSIHNPATRLPVSYYLALVQESPAGITYYSTSSDVIPEGAGWTRYGRRGLTAASFGKVSGPGPTNPDVSGSGGTIRFGYFTSNSHASGNPIETISGIDNWTVTVTSADFCKSLRGQRGTFFETNWAGGWNPTVFTQGGGGISSGVASSDPVSGAFLQVNISISAGTVSSPAYVYGFYENSGAVYDPQAGGAIETLGYCEDAKFFEGFGDGQGTGPALRQNGKVYVAYSAVTGLPANWKTIARWGLTAANFSQMNGPGGFIDAGSHPDFSARAAPITFGFLRANSSISGAYRTSIGIDNWLIAINPPTAVNPPPPPPPGVSCTFVPQNAVIGDHRPSWHRSRRGSSADHRLSVSVIADGVPARNVDVAVAATRPVFSTSPSELPTLSRLTVKTDDAGRAAFTINPPAPLTFDQTDFEATGSIGARTFRCIGSVTVGLGTLSALKSAAIGESAPNVSALAAGLLAPWWNLKTLLGLNVPPDRAVGGQEPAAHGARPFEPRARREMDTVVAHVRRNLGEFPAPGRCSSGATAASGSGSTGASPAGIASIPQKYANLPLRFEPNRGQLDRSVRFVSRAEGYEVYLKDREFFLVDHSPRSEPPASVRVRLAGADASARIEASERLPGRSHYLRGANRQASRLNVPQYAKVIYRQTYPGIDLVFHGHRRQLQFDFIVAAGANPGGIMLEFDGSDRLEIDRSGDLLVHHARGRVRLERPVVYQVAGRVRRAIDGNFVLQGEHRAGFAVAGYDAAIPLVIDPVVSFATYVGGNNADAGTAVAVDAQGNVYITGGTVSSNFPSLQAAQPNRKSPLPDVFVTKLNPTGTAVLYSTYIGGIGNDMGLGVAVDAAGSAYVTGTTYSPDFPLAQPLQRAPGGGAPLAGDAFVLKLDPSGSRFLYSTYFGGRQQDLGKAIAVDAAGNAYVAGATASADFPVRNAFQAVHRGTGPVATSAFVAKLNPAGTEIMYSTYLGGAGASAANAIAVDAAGNAYVTGGTDSTAFPVIGAFQSTNRGSQDAFVTRLSSAGAVVYSTYLGGEGDDMGMGIAVDGSGNAYLTGLTGSTGFPLESAAQQKPGSANLVGLDAFVTKISANGARLVYSTYLGGSGVDVGVGIAVGPDGSAYVAGETNSLDFPAVSPIQPAAAGLTEAFVARLNPSGSSLVYSTTLGGLGPDSAAAIAFHPSGVYVAGTSMSADFPATYGAYQPISAGRGDASVVKIVEGAPLPGFIGISGATFRLGEALAPDAIVAGFGEGLATGIQQAQATPLPTSLAGVSVRVKDAAGKDEPAPLFFVSPRQINFTVPAGLARGLAAVNVLRGGQTVASGTLRIESVAPGLFSANADGKGVAAGVAIRVAADGTQEPWIVFQCGILAGSCVPAATDMGGEVDRVFLLLFGTGIRGRSSLAAVGVTVGGQSVPVLAAEAQGQFAGLDQVNIGPLPRTLIGRGQVDIVLTVDGRRANAVTMAVK